MTPNELDVMRLKLRLLARTMALEQIVAMERRTPGGPAALADWASQLRAQADAVTVPRLDPANSDLTAAEWREALQEMLAELGL